MKLYIIFLLIIFYISNIAKAQERFEFSLATTYQQDNFRWSIAGNSNGTNPNVYSELAWKNLRGVALQASFNTKVWKAIFVEALLNHSLTLAGSANDTDYSEDNRVKPIFNADLESNKGFTNDYIIYVGYKFKNKTISISPYLGYGKSIQLMFLLNKGIKELNTSYKANWSGALAGFKVDAALKKRLYIKTDFAYHQINYTAKANWNLIDQFAHPLSFKHTANGFGLKANVEANYKVKKNTSVFISTQKSFWNTGAGIDELFYENGNKAYTKLNEVYRNSFSLGVGIKFHL